VRQSIMQTANGQTEQALATLGEAKKVLPDRSENESIVVAALKKVMPRPEPSPVLAAAPPQNVVQAPAAKVGTHAPTTTQVNRVKPIAYEPGVISGILVEPLDGPEAITELWRPNPGETSGPRLESVGAITGVDPGSYDLWCRTTLGGQLRLVSGLEV